jgi:biopolymer transport protein ExbD
VNAAGIDRAVRVGWIERSETHELNVTEMMNVLLVVYVLLVGVVVFVMGRWERAMRIPGYTP